MMRNPIPETIGSSISYEPETGGLIRIASPKAKFVGANAATSGKEGYLSVSFIGKLYAAHRVAWFLYYGQQPPEYLDHINGNRGDNRISNLRPVDAVQNATNRSKRQDAAKLPRGVTLHRQTGKYQAQIKARGKVIHLGLYSASDDAGAAYANAAMRYHGEFASFAR